MTEWTSQARWLSSPWEGQGREGEVGLVLLERHWCLEWVSETSTSQLNSNINHQHLLGTDYMLDTKLSKHLTAFSHWMRTLLYEVLLLALY